MLLKLSSVKSERKRIEEGDWIAYPQWNGPTGSAKVRFQVKGISSTAYRRAYEDLGKKLALKYKGEPIPDDIAHEMSGELLAEHLLLCWDGLDEPYSPERALELLTDRDYAAFQGAVEWCARRLENLNLEFVEETIKNSEAPSVIS